MTAAAGLNIDREVAAITKTLKSRRDSTYEWGMKRTVPSQQPAHAVRVPEIRRTAAEWRREYKGIEPEEMLALCDALWATLWREERIVAITLAGSSRASIAAVGWDRVEDWSSDIDNWEHVDHLAHVAGKIFVANPKLLTRVKKLSKSENPWQRRLALVTLIEAFRQDAAWRDELQTMASQLRKDPHPLVRRAFVWARDRLSKDHLHD